MSMNICLCGSGAGYAHHPDCPRPLFNCHDARQADAWDREFHARAEDRKRLAPPAGSRYHGAAGTDYADD